MQRTLPLTVWDLVLRAVEGSPEAPVVSDDHGRSLTRRQLRDAAEASAAALSARGVTAGTVVSWQLPTSLEAVVLLFALARIGAVQNPLIPILREREVSFITRQFGTELLVVPEEWRGFQHGAMARELAATGGFGVMEVDLHDLGAQDPPRGSGCRQQTPTRWRQPRHSTAPVGSTTRRAPRPTPRAPAIPTPASWPRRTPCST